MHWLSFCLKKEMQKFRTFIILIVIGSTLMYFKHDLLKADFKHDLSNTVTFHFDAQQQYLKFDADTTRDLESCQFSLRIIVIVFNRTKSMLRLLDSLNKADYGDDRIKLEIWIDSNKDGQTCVKTYVAALKFDFKHGHKNVYLHPSHVGLYGQWLTTYKPIINCSEIAVILEDDLTVSPHFYTYLKMVHGKYGTVPYINGFSLQGVENKFAHGCAGYIKGPENDLVYLYPVIGSWGFSPCAKNWAKFLDWFHRVRKNREFHPYVPNNVATDIYKKHEQSKRADNMWTIWHIYYAWKYNEFTLFSNFPNHEGLTTNWAEDGLHYNEGAGKPSNPLLQNWSMTYEQLPHKPAKIDINGEEMMRR